MAITKKQK